MKLDHVRHHKRQRGAVTIEQCFCIVFLLYSFLAVIDFSRASFAALAGQYAVSQAARWAAVGDTLPSMTREESIAAKFEEFARAVSLRPDLGQLEICPAVDPGCSPHNAGNPDEIIYIAYTHPTYLFSLSYTIELLSGSFTRNEPYPK